MTALSDIHLGAAGTDIALFPVPNMLSQAAVVSTGLSV